MQIQAIETTYNGYKFRSRLEARWAVFFDELKLHFDYESEGFQMGQVRYLPDFCLHSQLILYQFEFAKPKKLWVEIKPDTDLPKNEQQKIETFVKHSNNNLLLISGSPDSGEVLQFINFHPNKGLLKIDVRWIELPTGQIGLVPIKSVNDSKVFHLTDSQRLRNALRKAKQARFEHQQQPRTKRCVGCNKQFEPLYQYHEYCYSCYKSLVTCEDCGARFSPHLSDSQCPKCYEKSNVQAPKPLEPESIPLPPSKPKSKLTWILPASVLGIILAALMGWQFFSPESDTLTSPTTPPTSAPTPTIGSLPGRAELNEQTVIEEPLSSCDCSRNLYDCADFETQLDAQACFNFCYEDAGDIHFLDANEDKQACETLP